MSLKDTTAYNKLEADNWEEWEQNTLNLLDTRHLHKYMEVNYGLAIGRSAQQNCHLLGRFQGQGKFWLGKKFKDRFFIG